MDYEKKDTWSSGKNKPNSNPIQTQSNPIKANKMPKQTQTNPKQTQFVVSLPALSVVEGSNLFHLRPKARSRRINRLSGGFRLVKPPLISNIGQIMFGKKLFLTCFIIGLFVVHSVSGQSTGLNAPIDFSGIKSHIVLRGDSRTAYRDPAALYHAGKFYLFYTLVRTDSDGLIYSYTAASTSRDLQNFSTPRIITPKGQHLNFSSPGNVVRFGDDWILCLQTYPRLNYRRGEKLRWADQTARLFIMRSKDLVRWSEPELLRVKGPDVPVEKMGRMIDPYLIEDKDEPGKWWCFYKQRGVSLSWSYDLANWTYFGRSDSGENVCALVEGDEYVLFHSPGNGIGVKRSKDLKQWRDVDGLITLGQKQWPWAENRITAGVVLDLRKEPRIGKYIIFFHGGGPGRKKTQDNADANCSLGIAWSDDLKRWSWPRRALQ